MVIPIEGCELTTIIKNMTKTEVIKIFFLALIAGSIMGVVIIEIFGTLDLMKLLQLEICVILIIIFLFIVSRWWNNRLRKISNSNEHQGKNDENRQANNN
jgi:high-affinity Fe2+/Pb2+ permease